MDYRTAIFYLALALVVGCVAELFVRMQGMGEHVEKVRVVIGSVRIFVCEALGDFSTAPIAGGPSITRSERRGGKVGDHITRLPL